MKEVFKEQNMSITDKRYTVKYAVSAIGRMKEEMISWEDYLKEVDKADIRAWKTAKVYEAYQTRLFKNNALDFDDLIYKTVYLFRTRPDVLEKYQERFKYIMVDELSGHKHVPSMSLSGFWPQNTEIFALWGDDDQSIYGWRGGKHKKYP